MKNANLNDKNPNNPIELLMKARWDASGITCPDCGSKEYWRVQPYKFKCKRCYYQFTPTSLTLFHHSHVKLEYWFEAIRCYIYSLCLILSRFAPLKNKKVLALNDLYRIANIKSEHTAKRIRDSIWSVVAGYPIYSYVEALANEICDLYDSPPSYEDIEDRIDEIFIESLKLMTETDSEKRERQRFQYEKDEFQL